VERPFTVRISEHLSSGEVRWDIVTAKNLSASGILFNYDRYLEPGSRLRFRIALPVCEPVECEGEVIRNIMGKSPGYGRSEQVVCAVAASFKNISANDRQMMEEFLTRCDAAASEQKPAMPDRPNQARERRIDRSFPFWMQQEGQPNWEPVPMRNISASGLMINYPEPIEIGTELSFRLMLPFLQSPILCAGRVVRVLDKTHPNATVKFFNIGVEFSELDDTVRQQLREFAEKNGRE
jgi:hypothetical protein